MLCFNSSGGYNFANTARLWAYCTSLAVKEELSNEIPEHEVCHVTLLSILFPIHVMCIHRIAEGKMLRNLLVLSFSVF